MAQAPVPPKEQGAKRLSLTRSVVVVNREYLLSRRLPEVAYQKALLSHGAVAPRFEKIRREYSGAYRPGHPTIFREQNPPANTYCVASAARIFDADKDIKKLFLESNVLEANLSYENPDARPGPGSEKPYAEVNCDAFTFLMKGIVLDDERSQAGIGGILVSAARCDPDLLGMDKVNDERADATEMDATDKDFSEPQIIQPGVVFCRASAILSPDDIERGNARVAVLSERHVLILLLAANVPSTGVKSVCSFAWPTDEKDAGGERVFVMQRALYRDLLHRARTIANHLVENLVPYGQVNVKVKSVETEPRGKPLENVRMTVLVDYVRLCAAPDLLYRTGNAVGLFKAEDVPIYMCLHSKGPDSFVFSKRHDQKEDVFETQLAFAKGVVGSMKGRPEAAGKRCERLLEEFLEAKNNAAIVQEDGSSQAKVML